MSSSFCIQFFKPLLWALTTAILGISEHMAFESKSKSSGGAGSSTDTPQWCMDICLTASQKHNGYYSIDITPGYCYFPNREPERERETNTRSNSHALAKDILRARTYNHDACVCVYQCWSLFNVFSQGDIKQKCSLCSFETISHGLHRL